MAFIQQSKVTRVIRATPVSKASLLVEDSAISMVGNSRNFVKVDDRGTTIVGATSHVNMGPQRRKAGMWIDEFEWTMMIPKCILTPFPIIYPMPPIFALADWGKGVAFFAGLLAM